jgi:hypothetical protein
MYPEPGAPHHHQHFHARYAGSTAVYRISPITRLNGQISGSQEDLVLHWANMHQKELQRNWVRLQQGKTALPIAPLS